MVMDYGRIPLNEFTDALPKPPIFVKPTLFLPVQVSVSERQSFDEDCPVFKLKRCGYGLAAQIERERNLAHSCASLSSPATRFCKSHNGSPTACASLTRKGCEGRRWRFSSREIYEVAQPTWAARVSCVSPCRC